MVVGVCAWGHVGHVGDLGALEGQPDVWWDWTRVWVGPVTWGIIEGCHWGSGMSLWGLGYMVHPGDMVGCMECGMESAKVAVQRVARCNRQVGRGDRCGVMDEQALASTG